MTAKNGHQLYIPVGFAHGFVTLSQILKSLTSVQIIIRLKRKVRRCGVTLELILIPISGKPILSDKDASSYAKHLIDPICNR